MRTLIAVAMLILPLAAGCKRPTFPPTSPKKDDPSLAGRIAGKVKETVTMVEMHDLHLLMETASSVDGRMLTPAEVKDYAKKENPKLFRLLEDGSIVLTGIKQREGLWAYEKDAPEKGGWVLTNTGEQKLSADDVKRLLGK